MNKLVNEAEQVKYVVKVNGAIVSPPYASAQLAEAAIVHLTEAHQSIAEVVTITSDGQEVLMG